MATNYVNPNSLLLSKFDALTDQVSKLNDYFSDQEKRIHQTDIQHATLREQQAKRAKELGDLWLPTSVSQGDTRLPPDSSARTGSGRNVQLSLDDEAQLSAQLAAMRQQAQQQAAQSQARLGNTNWTTNGTAWQAGGGVASPTGGVGDIMATLQNPIAAGQAALQGPTEGPITSNDALTLAMLGEHGGPAALRNTALDYYMFNRSIGWAQNIGQGLSNQYANSSLTIPGASAALGGLNNTLGWAQRNAGKLFLGYKALTGFDAAGAANQMLGQQLGYGAPAAFGQNIFGFRNPLGNVSTAAQVGTASNIEAQALEGRLPGMGFGNGLSSAQAQSVMQTLTGQGFGMQPIAGGGVAGGAISALGSLPIIGGPLSGIAGSIANLLGSGPQGNAAMIAQNFMRPMMERFPGLSAGDLGQFTGALRYGGTSIQQLSDQLNSLGVEARAAQETVGQFASSVSQTSDAFQSLGSSAQGGYALATGFTNVTGKSPQFAATLGQSPLVQGLALSQYGILPSGLGDMNSGAFAGTGLAALQMLQRATAGLDRNKYKMVNGQEVLIQSGKQAQYDQIAQMTGLPSNVVKSMLEDESGITARANAQEMLGDSTTGTGFYQYLDQHKGQLTAAQAKLANQDWNKTVANTWRGTGVSQAEMERIDKISGLRDRAKAYSGALANAAKNDQANQIQNSPNTTTVKVEFTGAAAKIFQQAGPSINKAISNAGGTSFNSIVNSVAGDLTGSGNPIASLVGSLF